MICFKVKKFKKTYFKKNVNYNYQNMIKVRILLNCIIFCNYIFVLKFIKEKICRNKRNIPIFLLFIHIWFLM